MKKVFVLILIGSLFFGCKSRKVERDKSTLKTNKIEQKDISKDSNAVIKTNVKIFKSSGIWRFKPIDSTKPMVINGQEFDNAEVENEETKEEKTINKTDSVTTKKIDKSKTEEKEEIKLNKKAVDVENQSYILYYFAGVGLLLVIIYYFIINRKKPKQE